MDKIVAVEETREPFWEAVKAFECGFAKVTKQFHYLPPRVGSYDWRIAMSDHVGNALAGLGWTLPDLVRNAEQRAYGYVRQGGKNSVSCSVASPNSIRRLKTALQKLRPAPIPGVPAEGNDTNWLW